MEESCRAEGPGVPGSSQKSDRRSAIIAKFNEEFGGDISIFDNAAEHREKLESQKREIENALSLDSSGDAPSKIALAMGQFQNAIDKVNELSRKQADLQQSYAKYQEEVDKINTKMGDYIFKINELEKACEYLKIIERIGDVSDMIEASLNEKNEKKQETNFMLLKSIYKSLKEIKCNHLLTYTKETLHYWHNILKDKLGTDYVEVLKAIKWPFVKDCLDSMPSPENLNKLKMLTEHLLNIELDEDTKNSTGSDDKPLSLPMTLLIKPLRKRFMYHFMGSRKTNRADKPEWYFTQVLSWIKAHQEFVDKNLQSAYDRAKKTDELAKFEFIRGLIEITVKKLHYELSELQYDDSLFSHCIDEALGFEKELRKGYGYPEDKPAVLNVLTQAPILVKWINMEKRYATEKLEKFLKSKRAFDILMSWELEVYRCTECAEFFLNLLSTITERYEMLPQPGHRLQFMQVELDLIADFRNRLMQKVEQAADPFDHPFPNILNTIHYVRSVLEDMGSDTFFLRLQFYKSKLEGKGECDGTVFDEHLDLLAATKDQLITMLVDHVFMEFKAKSMLYRKNKWHAMEPPEDLVYLSITPTACPMFQVLIDRLHEMQKLLATELFRQAWSTLAVKLDQYLYEEIVAICIFNDGGAHQFNYDVTKNLFPLFAQYSTKPEGHFKLLRDSCTLLVMPVGVAMSLRDTLDNMEEIGDTYDSGEVLQEVGVFTLKKSDVLTIISHRTDIS